MNEYRDTMTPHEHDMMDKLGSLAEDFVEMSEKGPTHNADFQEAVFHIHALQNMVLAQSAARAYPISYRAMGASLAMRIGERRRAD